MAENQHRLITGYRELHPTEISAINALKEREAEMGEILSEITENAQIIGDGAVIRWAAIARTHLETGFMYAIKAVARPTNGLGRK